MKTVRKNILTGVISQEKEEEIINEVLEKWKKGEELTQVEKGILFGS